MQRLFRRKSKGTLESDSADNERLTMPQNRRKGGRQKGTGNIEALQKIKQNKNRLEKMLLEKALTGDVEAIKACLELIKDDVVIEEQPDES